jgi:hypothetical protein
VLDSMSDRVFRETVADLVRGEIDRIKASVK